MEYILESHLNPSYSRIPCYCFPPRRCDMLCECEKERQYIVKQLGTLQSRMRRNNWYFNQSIIITNEPSAKRRVIFEYFYNSPHFNASSYFMYYVHLWTIAENELMIINEYQNVIKSELEYKVPNVLRNSFINKLVTWVIVIYIKYLKILINFFFQDFSYCNYSVFFDCIKNSPFSENGFIF